MLDNQPKYSLISEQVQVLDTDTAPCDRHLDCAVRPVQDKALTGLLAVQRHSCLDSSTAAVDAVKPANLCITQGCADCLASTAAAKTDSFRNAPEPT